MKRCICKENSLAKLEVKPRGPLGKLPVLAVFIAMPLSVVLDESNFLAFKVRGPLYVAIHVVGPGLWAAR